MNMVVFLREKSGERTFPIVISVFEAFAIDRFVKEQRPPRPLQVVACLRRQGDDFVWPPFARERLGHGPCCY